MFLGGRSHIVCRMVKFNMSSLHTQLVIIVIDISPIKITLKDIIHQKELSHLNIAQMLNMQVSIKFLAL